MFVLLSWFRPYQRSSNLMWTKIIIHSLQLWIQLSSGLLAETLPVPGIPWWFWYQKSEGLTFVKLMSLFLLSCALAKSRYRVGQNNEKLLTWLNGDFFKVFELSAKQVKRRLIATECNFKIVFAYLSWYPPNFQSEQNSFHMPKKIRYLYIYTTMKRKMSKLYKRRRITIIRIAKSPNKAKAFYCKIKVLWEREELERKEGRGWPRIFPGNLKKNHFANCYQNPTFSSQETISGFISYANHLDPHMATSCTMVRDGATPQLSILNQDFLSDKIFKFCSPRLTLLIYGPLEMRGRSLSTMWRSPKLSMCCRTKSS